MVRNNALFIRIICEIATTSQVSDCYHSGIAKIVQLAANNFVFDLSTISMEDSLSGCATLFMVLTEQQYIQVY
jgi:hypothetical protein